ncbi:Oidioi.mRNA.OKI2018_I69.XSR.g15689.t1.cds [Oikopleura dioica]|uniref:Oidioi.mRNA.OKI2018_I69.XSR.g15689.t1.cds n=1 Tax=Oikopleura dioica TaxID=34765 RepID=A0ABN7SHV4_OIKDI|nr:Oidioi.mRNA.OKI2018_I69.XSR.g15689.t1.cds [Oikopleura dioica]
MPLKIKPMLNILVVLALLILSIVVLCTIGTLLTCGSECHIYLIVIIVMNIVGLSLFIFSLWARWTCSDSSVEEIDLMQGASRRFNRSPRSLAGSVELVYQPVNHPAHPAAFHHVSTRTSTPLNRLNSSRFKSSETLKSSAPSLYDHYRQTNEFEKRLNMEPTYLDELPIVEEAGNTFGHFVSRRYGSSNTITYGGQYRTVSRPGTIDRHLNNRHNMTMSTSTTLQSHILPEAPQLRY